MTILKRIPKVLSPRLLHILASMGHGDEIVIAGTVQVKVDGKAEEAKGEDG